MRYVSFVLLHTLLLLTPRSLLAAGAERALSGLSETGDRAGFGKTPTPYTTFIAYGINTILGLSGILLMGTLVYAGILYLTSSGDQEKVKSAKGMIVSSIVGIVIVLASYAISQFVLEQVGLIVKP